MFRLSFLFRDLRFHLSQGVLGERGSVSEADVGLVGPRRRRDGVQLSTQEIALKRDRYDEKKSITLNSLRSEMGAFNVK